MVGAYTLAWNGFLLQLGFTFQHVDAHTQDQSAHLVSVGHWKGLFNVYTVCLWLQAGGGQQFLHFCLKWVISTCLDISTQMHTLKYQSVIGKDCFNTVCSLLVTTFDGMLQSPVCKLWSCYVIWVTSATMWRQKIRLLQPWPISDQSDVRKVWERKDLQGKDACCRNTMGKQLKRKSES